MTTQPDFSAYIGKAWTPEVEAALKAAFPQSAIACLAENAESWEEIRLWRSYSPGRIIAKTTTDGIIAEITKDNTDAFIGQPYTRELHEALKTRFGDRVEVVPAFAGTTCDSIFSRYRVYLDDQNRVKSIQHG